MSIVYFLLKNKNLKKRLFKEEYVWLKVMNIVDFMRSFIWIFQFWFWEEKKE
jgi:hypothetical protein